ncbi:MAG: DUF1810 domain-containing protein [Clostridia bacterium]|nr:DUF1810 domain-containing protein [Clostridia bacterium]
MNRDYDLERFLEAQSFSYAHALREIQRGRKQTHWMWYIFPQLRGLGRSYNSQYYGIADINEARAYLEHPVLGARLRELCEILLGLEQNDPYAVMGSPDDIKLRSSMTLFAHVAEDNAVFLAVLDKFFGGKQDGYTLRILNK